MAGFPFPSVTICSPGLNMESVEEALLEDFNQWLNEKSRTGGSLKDWLDEFMEKKYATKSEKILETIMKMNSPPPSREEERSSGAVLQKMVACEAAADQGDKRKKRSNEGGFSS